MKKFFVIMLAVFMLLSCAFAEEVVPVEEEILVYAFDPAVLEGIDGEYMLLQDYGVQIFIPSNFIFLEPTEEQIANGYIAIMAANDGSISMSILYAGVANAEGALITDTFELAAFYESCGATDIEVAVYNDMLGMSYVMHDPIDYDGRAYISGEGAVLAFNAMGDGTEEMRELAQIIVASVMPAPVEEVVE